MIDSKHKERFNKKDWFKSFETWFNKQYPDYNDNLMQISYGRITITDNSKKLSSLYFETMELKQSANTQSPSTFGAVSLTELLFACKHIESYNFVFITRTDVDYEFQKCSLEQILPCLNVSPFDFKFTRMPAKEDFINLDGIQLECQNDTFARHAIKLDKDNLEKLLNLFYQLKK